MSMKLKIVLNYYCSTLSSHGQCNERTGDTVVRVDFSNVFVPEVPTPTV